MLSRRQFLVLAGLSVAGCDPAMLRRLVLASGGGSSFAPPAFSWQVTSPSAATIESNLAATLAANEITVTVGTPQETGYRPASVYNALWTRDHAYVVWHYPSLLTAQERRDFVTYTLSRRTTGAEADPDGGTLPADWIADRIDASGTAAYKNAGASELPFMDGIMFVILALWADWTETGSTATYTANQAAIEACLAVIPTSASGCVWSDPANPSVDYGFTDTVKKTGDVAYGTALLAWAYKMLGEISGGSSYDAARASAEAGLATLRQPDGWYAGSSGNNASVDDVWATALIAAEGLAPYADCVASGQAIADAYNAGTISQFGLVRHLIEGQFWTGTSTTQGQYQNGGYWLTPLWDCVRAVKLVDPDLALTWAAEAMTQLNDERTAEGTWLNVPYEWHNNDIPSAGAKGYSASAALVHRFV